MSDAAITYLTVEIKRALEYCADEFDLNFSEAIGTLHTIAGELAISAAISEQTEAD